MVLFAISTAFPITASLLPATGAPTALGTLDVFVAAVVVTLGFGLEGAGRDRIAADDWTLAWRIIRVLATLPLLLLIVFFVRADVLRWDVLLVGLAWRTWLLVWVLPGVVSVLRRGA